MRRSWGTKVDNKRYVELRDVLASSVHQSRAMIVLHTKISFWSSESPIKLHHLFASHLCGVAIFHVKFLSFPRWGTKLEQSSGM